jgi:hypothetical protein
MATKTVDQSVVSSTTVRPRARAPNVLPFPALRLVPPAPPPVCAETIEALERLLEEARSGRVRGVAAVVGMTGRRYSVEVCGDWRADPTLARGAVAAIDDELRKLVYEGSA